MPLTTAITPAVLSPLEVRLLKAVYQYYLSHDDILPREVLPRGTDHSPLDLDEVLQRWLRF